MYFHAVTVVGECLSVRILVGCFAEQFNYSYAFTLVYINCDVLVLRKVFNFCLGDVSVVFFFCCFFSRILVRFGSLEWFPLDLTLWSGFSLLWESLLNLLYYGLH